MKVRSCLAALVLWGVVSLPQVARADVSSWYSTAGGVSVISQGETLASPVLDLDLGVGTNPASPFVLGGLFRFGAQFEVGMDFGGALRLCSGSYARGTWGYGIDLGSHYRAADLGGAAAAGRVFVGGPWGLVLHLGGSYGENDVATWTASLGIDWARFSAHRSHDTDWFPSPLNSQDTGRREPGVLRF